MKKKILIVDDDPDFVQAVSILLESKGYEVHTANSGQEGFEKAIKVSPDLITLDIMMTNDSEGLDIAKKLGKEEKTKRIPVIIVSGIRKASNFIIDFATGEKVLDVKATLEKPIDPELLLKTIQNYIDVKNIFKG